MTTSTASTGIRSLIATAILGALASSFSTVSAAAVPSSASVTVTYTALELESPSGSRALYKRIRAAAQSACSYFVFATDVDEARCVHDAIARAVNEINQPALSAVAGVKLKTPAACTLVSQNR
jgi:UrcA family protein